MKKFLPLFLFFVPAFAFALFFYIRNGERREFEHRLEVAADRQILLESEVLELERELVSVRKEASRRESQLFSSRRRSSDLERYIEERAANPDIKAAYITIDDGPSTLTHELLDVLARKNVPATFFVVGEEDPELSDNYHYIVDAGYPLGNHSYHHEYSTIYSSKDEFWKDIELQEEFLSKYTDQPVRLFRFPGGSNNPQPLAHGGGEDMISELKDELEDRGYIYHDWNVYPDDVGEEAKSVEELVDRAINQIKYRKNITILLHDHEMNVTTPEALELIIDYLIEEGYCILPLSEKSVPVRF